MTNLNQSTDARFATDGLVSVAERFAIPEGLRNSVRSNPFDLDEA